jgi:hypothetical protein
LLNLYVDADGDGFGSGIGIPTCVGNSIPSGYATNNTDCNDNDSTIWQNGTFYVDADGDGYGAGASQTICYGTTTPAGYSLNNIDCNDNDSTITVGNVYYADADGDGYGDANNSVTACSAPSGYVLDNTDCNDNDSLINPNTVWFLDNDGDGYGDASNSVTACTAPFGYVTNNTDCDDSDTTAFISANVFIDYDADGYSVGSTTICYDGFNLPTGYSLTSNGSDCNDNDVNVYSPSADASFVINNSNDPVVGFIANNTSQTSYAWYIDGTMVGSGTALTYTFTLNGTYNVSLVTVGTCGATDSTGQTVTIVNTYAKSSVTKPVISVVPNPASTYVKLKVIGVNNGEVEIVSISGQIVAKEKFVANNWLQFNTSDFANGVYFIKVKGDTANHTERLIINR